MLCQAKQFLALLQFAGTPPPDVQGFPVVRFPDSDLIAIDGRCNYHDFISEANGGSCSLCIDIMYSYT